MNEPKLIRVRFWILAVMVVAAAATRLVTPSLGLYNFSPIGALALFGGACFASPAAALLVPLAAMALSDVGIYFLQGYPPSWPVYVCFTLLAIFGFALRRRRSKTLIAGATAVSSLVFFFVTNTAVWLLSPNLPLPGSCPDSLFEQVAWAFSGAAASIHGYPKTLSGLLTCWIAGIPFFPNTLLGDAFYMVVLFGGWALVEKRLTAQESALAPAVS